MPAGARGGGIFAADWQTHSGRILNSIAQFNYHQAYASGLTVDNLDLTTNVTVGFSCTAPLNSGAGNIVDDPSFVNRAGRNYRLASGSGCIDRGTNETWMTTARDLDGNPRIANVKVDMGAYENQSAGSGNLLLNGNMEVVGASWVLGGGMAYETWAARNGNYGLAMYGWTSSGLAYQDVSPNGASSYTFTVYGCKDTNYNLSALTTQLKLEFFNGSQMVKAYTNTITSAPVSWTQYSVGGAAPTGITSVRAVLIFGGTVSAGAFKWDDAQLTGDGNGPLLKMAGQTTTKAPAPAATPSALVAAPVSSGSKTAKTSAKSPTKSSASGLFASGLTAVTTSDDAATGTNGLAAVDGNTKTAWVGNPKANGWWIALTYEKAFSLSDLNVTLGDGSPTNVTCMYSTNADNWYELRPALTNGAVKLNYLWLIFPADGSGVAPVVREIEVNQAAK